MTMLRGSCQCGGVKYEITGPLHGMGHCHCSNCRKAHSAAFRTRARVQRTDFKVVQGDHLVKFYESSPDFHRGFCSLCGSPVFNWNGPKSHMAKLYPDSVATIGIAVAGLDDDPGVRPGFHCFVAEKAAWLSIADDLPQFSAYP